MSSVGENMKKYRKMKQLTQQQIADMLGIKQPIYAGYENGVRVPKFELRTQIARTLRVDPIALSGIELTEEEEIRILNKLLVKYAMRMENEPDQTVVMLPDSFRSLADVYNEYKAPAKVTGEEDYELGFWLEMWPEFDSRYQARVKMQEAGFDPGADSGVLQKVEEVNLKKKFLDRLEDVLKSLNRT